MLKLKFFYLLLLFLWLPVATAQEETDPPPYDEALEANLENFKSKQQDAAKALDLLNPAQKEKLMEAIKSGDQERVQELMKEVTLSATKNPEGVQKLIKFSLKQFRQKSASDVRSEIEGRVSGTIFEPVANTLPKLVDFLVNLLRDPNALPEFFKIAGDRKRLLIFFGINIALFLIKWMIKRNEKKKGALASERFARFFFFFGLRFVLIGVFFHKELWPLVIVAKRTFS